MEDLKQYKRLSLSKRPQETEQVMQESDIEILNEQMLPPYLEETSLPAKKSKQTSPNFEKSKKLLDNNKEASTLSPSLTTDLALAENTVNKDNASLPNYFLIISNLPSNVTGTEIKALSKHIHSHYINHELNKRGLILIQ